MYLADEIGEQVWLTQLDLAGPQFFHDHGGYAAAAVWLTFCILVTDRTQRR
jgi:hypothetical protein